jgi:hypothetical protein
MSQNNFDEKDFLEVQPKLKVEDLLKLMETFSSNKFTYIPSKVDIAALKGDKELLNSFLKKGNKLSPVGIGIAFATGKEEIFELLWNYGIKPSFSDYCIALRMNKRKFLDWLNEKKYKPVIPKGSEFIKSAKVLKEFFNFFMNGNTIR